MSQVEQIEESWADVARNTREALFWLGRPIEPRCLPDEQEPCGGTFTLHALAHFATIKAICDHQLEHLGLPAETVEEIYQHALAEIRTGPCQLCGEDHDGPVA